MKNRKIIINTILWAIICIFILFLIFFFISFKSWSDREYHDTYTFPIPNSDAAIIVKEWSSFRISGIEFYFKGLDKKEIFLDEVDTDEYLPFSYEGYDFNWMNDYVEVNYKYTSKVWESIILDYSQYIDKLD